MIKNIYRITRPKNGARNDMKLSGNARVMFDVVSDGKTWITKLP
ncbi:Uncharacterised protein [Orientia tsutsugamushi]|uniref:Uncharacterized protein n=1 Tax=Orientia tsutsugamushi TaxID=784 RepID=A0A2U3QVG6_ORITS|nr:Uncharacterised protein [Orientia tsutsugamushi]